MRKEDNGGRWKNPEGPGFAGITHVFNLACFDAFLCSIEDPRKARNVILSSRGRGLRRKSVALAQESKDELEY